MNWEIILTGIITLVVGIFSSTGFWTYYQNKKNNNSDEQKMIMGLTYITIVKHCEFWIERGWADPDDLDDLQKYLYDPYINKGGNGTAKRKFQMACSLPSKPPKEETK